MEARGNGAVGAERGRMVIDVSSDKISGRSGECDTGSRPAYERVKL